MVTAEQVMKLSCRDCGWTGEADMLNAKKAVAEHINYYSDQDECLYHNHTVEGINTVVFRYNYH